MGIEAPQISGATMARQEPADSPTGGNKVLGRLKMLLAQLAHSMVKGSKRPVAAADEGSVQ
jgi:hypothetical protein